MRSFQFEPNNPTATAGTLVFVLNNDTADDAIPQSHNMVIGPDRDHSLVDSGYVLTGKSVVFTVDGLAAGTYTFWCSVPHHADNGMVGTLTVTP